MKNHLNAQSITGKRGSLHQRAGSRSQNGLFSENAPSTYNTPSFKDGVGGFKFNIEDTDDMKRKKVGSRKLAKEIMQRSKELLQGSDISTPRDGIV